MNWRCGIRMALCASIGLAFSGSSPIGIVSSIAFPALALNTPSRREAFWAAASYYAGASWPLIVAVRNFFGAAAGIADGFVLWVAASCLLALPWPLIWCDCRSQHSWRAPLGLLLTVVPPLGLIGWASPVTAAGYLFPGTKWFGVLAVMMAVGSLASVPRAALPLIALLAVGANLSSRVPAQQLAWTGIDTHFGGISHEQATALQQLQVAEAIQRDALASPARVVVFPETVVPNWSLATDAFWSQTISKLRESGKTIIVGSKIDCLTPTRFNARDFGASVAILRAETSVPEPQVAPSPPASFKNVLVIRGANVGLIEQRVPVPLGMWKPFAEGGVRLRLVGPGVVSVAGERAAVLICYEQLLSWPILTSIVARPTVIVAVANDYWAGGTTIPKAQRAAVRAWARLLSVPYVSATNY